MSKGEPATKKLVSIYKTKYHPKYYRAVQYSFLFLQIIPVPSDSQLTLVDLVCALKTLKTDTILQLVKEVVKKPPQIKGEEVTPLA